MKALIYARQSSGNDDLSESVEAQIENCKKLAAKDQIEIIGIFRDLNTSGETYPAGSENVAMLDKAYNDWVKSQSSKKSFRNGLGEALQLLDGVDFILVNELTRLYRPITDSYLAAHINQKLVEHNVKIMQVQGGTIDLTKTDHQLVTAIKNQILYEDLQKKRANSRNAFRNKRNSGKLCCGTHIFGIKYLGHDEIQVVPECIEIVRFVFNSICAFKSYSSIIKDCNERWRGQVFFYSSSIYSIARQPLYAGYQYNSEGELIKNVQITGQEIISLEQWLTTQKILDTKRREGRVRTHKNWLPLSAKLFCGHCGGKLVCDFDHGKIYYICKRKDLDRGHSKCKSSRIRFETGARGQSSLYEALYPLLTVALIERQRRAVELLQNKDKISEYEIALENMKKKEQELFDMFSEGLASKDQLRNMLVNHKAKKTDLLKKIAMTKMSDISQGNVEELQSGILVSMFNDLAAKTLSHSIFEKLLNDAEITATVYSESVEFHTKYGDVSIPRLKVKTRTWMPDWELKLINTQGDQPMKLDENSQIIATYLTGHEATLADFGVLRIQSR